MLVDRAERRLEVACDPAAAAVRQLLDELDSTHTAIDKFAVRSASLDDVFLALTDSETNTPTVFHPDGRLVTVAGQPIGLRTSLRTQL